MASLDETLDLFELAPEILIVLADVATLIGIKRLDRKFGILGGELAALSELVQKPSNPSQEDIFRRRVKKLLKEIEKACTVCLPQCLVQC